MPPQEAGIAYLRDEIDWHRRAGRLLFGFLLGAVGSLVLYLRDSFQFFRDGLVGPGGVKWDIVILSIPPLVLVLLSITILWHFWRYCSRISGLKDTAQKILGQGMPEGPVKVLWTRIFGE